MAAAFEELLASLFSSLDLLIVDPSDARVRAAAAPLLRRELERSEAHATLLARQSERLVDLGFHAQVTISPDAANVFLHDENGRERLVREDGTWLLRRTRRRITDEALGAAFEQGTDAFSPNVLLRPVVESALFPTVAYVAGPAELSYFAQIGCLFEAHGIMPPVVFPRFSVTLIETKVRKVLDKFGMSPEDFTRPFHEVASQLVRDEMPMDVRQSLEVLRGGAQENWDRLAEAAQAIDPTLRGWLEGLRNSALSQTDAAEKKIASHLKKKNEVELEQVRKASVNLYPEGSPQERILNPLPFLARYGTELLLELLAALEPPIHSPAAGWTGLRC
jgi:bacillithiol biosynthesis cysteine-adding enzyme BshC